MKGSPFLDNLLQHRELKQILEEQDERMDNVSTQLNQVYEKNQVLIEEAEQRGVYKINKSFIDTDSIIEAMAILNWVSQSPPNDDHTRILEHGKLNNEYANSGQWLFSCPEFRSWGEIENQDASTLWLRGPGKTVQSP